MSLMRSRIFRVIAMIGVGRLLALPVFGQNVNSTAGVILSNAEAVAEMPPGPVELFRQVLVIDPVHREVLLANRAARNRKEPLHELSQCQALSTKHSELRH